MTWATSKLSSYELSRSYNRRSEASARIYLTEYYFSVLPQPDEQARRLGYVARNPTTVSANPTDVLSNIENWRTSFQKLNELTNWIPMKEDIKTAFESLIAPVVEHVSEFKLSRELIKRKAYSSITTTDADVYKYITSIQEEILKLPRSTQWKRPSRDRMPLANAIGEACHEEADSQEYQEEAYDAYSQEQDDVEEADEGFDVDKWHEEMYGPYEDETHQEEWDGDGAYQDQEDEGYDDEAYEGHDDGTYEEEGYDDEAYDGYDDGTYEEEGYDDEAYDGYDDGTYEQEGYDNEAWEQEEGYDDEAYDEQEGYDNEAWEQEEGYDDEAYDEQEEGYDDEAYDEQEGYDEAYDQEGNWDGDDAYQDQEQEWCGDEAENYEEDTRQFGQCIFFASPEGCRRGDMCRYRHDCDPNTGVPLPAPNRSRRRYRRSRRGEPGPEESYNNLPIAGRPQELHPGIGCCIVPQRPPGLSQ